MYRRTTTNDIAIHGAWTRPELDVGVEEIREWHLARGFTDIGYHYVIRRDGTVEEGRDPDLMGAHVLGHNSNSIGICLVGGRPEGDVDIDGSWDCNYTLEQLWALGDLLEGLVDTYGSDIRTIQGHRDYEGVHKDCPGFDVQAVYGSLIRELIGG